MKKIFMCLFIFATIPFFLGIKGMAAGKPFNVSSKSYFLGSLYKNILEVNEEFRDIEDPFFNPELYKYALAFNDVLYEHKTDYESILINHGIQYTRSNDTNTADVYESKLQYQTSSLYY